MEKCDESALVHFSEFNQITSLLVRFVVLFFYIPFSDIGGGYYATPINSFRLRFFIHS